MKKTLGGDRIGSGKKMTFDTKTFNRSTHNLGRTWRSTMSAGPLVPFLVLPTLPGDTIDIDLEFDARTLPTTGPLFGSYKAQLDVYQIPLRLYMRDLQMNKIEIGKDMSKVQFPLMEIKANDIASGLDFEYSVEQPWGGKEINNSQIEPSTILSYLGIKGLGQSHTRYKEVKREFNAIPWLMYWDIFKQYYANKMEDFAYVIHNPMTTQSELPDQVNLITNNEQTTVGFNNAYITDVDQQLIVTLVFASYKNYAQYLQDQMIVTLQTSLRTYRYTNLDFYIGRNDSQLKIIYQLKESSYPTGPTNQSTVTISNTIEFDFIKPNLQQFALKNIDTMRETIMTKPGTSPLILNQDNTFSPYIHIFQQVPSAQEGVSKIRSLQCKQEGLALKTYQSDVNNNWLNTEWIEGENGVNAVTAIQTDENGKFTLDEFNIKKKVYDMLNHIVASGGSYDDWQDTIWGVQRMKQISSPVYEGGLSKEIVFQEVISNAASNEQGEQPLGTLAGRGVVGNKHKGGKLVIKCSEPSYIIGIVSLTPRVDYSQGNEWHTNLKNMNELHNPYLDAIGYQDLITDTVAFWDTRIKETTGQITYKSAGKQPSWINYQTAVNQVYGNFALENEQMFMVLNRRYEVQQVNQIMSIGDMTTYIDPSKYNHIFADTSPDAMNFWVQIGMNIEARRVMSANQIPNL